MVCPVYTWYIYDTFIHDTNQPLLHLMNKIYENLNKPQPEFTLGIFLDLKKAFDCCDLNILLKKLEYYGFKNVTNTCTGFKTTYAIGLNMYV